jgi:hypothetical protein
MIRRSLVSALAIAIVGLGSVGLGRPAQGALLFAADGALSNTGNLYRVDTSTAIASVIGQLVDAAGNRYSINGMVVDQVTGILYGSTSAASPTLANGLVRINTQTAQVTQVGLLGLTPPNFAADLDIRNGVLYGWAEGSLSSLITINRATGAAAVVGPNGLNINTTGSGLASNAAGTMYSTPNLATGNLYQVLPATGQLVAPTPLSGGSTNGRIAALEFQQGILYGAELVGDGTSGIISNRLVSINPFTGAIANIGQFRLGDGTFLRNIDAIAAPVIPEPSSVALLGVGAAALGLRWRRRRSARA